MGRLADSLVRCGPLLAHCSLLLDSSLPDSSILAGGAQKFAGELLALSLSICSALVGETNSRLGVALTRRWACEDDADRVRLDGPARLEGERCSGGGESATGERQLAARRREATTSSEQKQQRQGKRTCSRYRTCSRPVLLLALATRPLCACLAHIRRRSRCHQATQLRPQAQILPLLPLLSSSFAAVHSRRRPPTSTGVRSGLASSGSAACVCHTQLDGSLRTLSAGLERLNRRLSATFQPSTWSASLNRCSTSSRAASGQFRGTELHKPARSACLRQARKAQPGGRKLRRPPRTELPRWPPPSVLLSARGRNHRSPNEKQTHRGTQRTHWAQVYCSPL